MQATDSHGNTRSKSATITVSSSLTINTITLNSCDVAAPYALYEANVTGGDSIYTYDWKGMETGSLPFVYFDAIPPYLHFSNTSTIPAPFFNNLMPTVLTIYV